MSNINSINNYYNKLVEITNNYGIEIIKHNSSISDMYISFKFKKNCDFFDRIFYLREVGYNLTFKFRNNEISVTISGKDNLYRDIIDSLDTKRNKLLDLKEIITLLGMFKKEDNISYSAYCDGISYYYSVDDNKYGQALQYNGFSNTNNGLLYKSNSNDVAYNIFKKINNDILAYKRLTKNMYKYEDIETIKNPSISSIKDIYNKSNKDKELHIMIKDNKGYVIIKVLDKIYKFSYNLLMFNKNVIPELLEMYIDSSNLNNEEESNCIAKSFYQSLSDNSIYIYNIDEENMITYINYLKERNNNKLKQEENNKPYLRVLEPNTTNRSSGFINIFILSFGVFILSVITFLITLKLIK